MSRNNEYKIRLDKVRRYINKLREGKEDEANLIFTDYNPNETHHDYAGSITLTGTPRGDTIYGTYGNDIIFADSGNDTIYAMGGNNIIFGGRGNDALFGADGNDRLFGGDGMDYLSGADGNDFLSGGQGNDFLYGGRGDDVLFGGAGNDYMEGGPGEDILFGGDGDDEMYGGIGNDIIFGGNGHDIIYGGDGDDIITGGEGNDYMLGGGGGDTYVFSGKGNNGKGDGHDTIYNYAAGNGFEKDIIHFYDVDAETVRYSGEDHDLVIHYADSSVRVEHFFWDPIYQVDEIAYSDSNNTTVEVDDLRKRNIDFRYSGDTFIQTWDGPTTIYGNNGVINQIQLQSDSGHTVIGGNHGNYIEGGGGNDQLYGGDSNDTILGGDGDDIIDGGLGHDYLIGGEGDDTYIYGLGYGEDVINNYDTGRESVDKIQFKKGIRPQDVRVSITKDRHLEFSFAGTSDKLYVEHHFAGFKEYMIDLVVFDDGTTWDQQILALKALGGGRSALSADDSRNAMVNSSDQDVQGLISAISSFGGQSATEDSISTDTSSDLSRILLAASY